MNGIFLLLGTNLGEREVALHTASAQIAIHAEIIRKSSIYESPSWGMPGQPDYLNQVLEIACKTSPTMLMQHLLEIETNMGRVRSVPNAPRLIDIDILYFRDFIVNTPSLSLPHPRLHLRKFTLLPMVELEAGFIHPVFQKNQQQLLDICPDRGEVTQYR